MGLLKQQQELSLNTLPAFGFLTSSWDAFSSLRKGDNLVLLQLDMLRLAVAMGGLPFSGEKGRRDGWAGEGGTGKRGGRGSCDLDVKMNK